MLLTVLLNSFYRLQFVKKNPFSRKTAFNASRWRKILKLWQLIMQNDYESLLIEA